jgi:uncharacterized surface protein with fasciclin (FAS1) repeats
MAPTAAMLGLAAPVALFLAGCGDSDDAATKNIAEIATDAPELKTLVAALTATDLVSAVSAKDPKKTVFAPVNEAFDALGNETLNCLLKPVGLPTLSNVLKYHVVPQEAKASDLKNDESLETLDGKNTLTVSLDGATVTIKGGSDSANVTKADIMATNGVVHEVNAVLIPEDFVAPQCGSGNIAETASATDSLQTLVAALNAANLTETFEGNTVYTVFAPTDTAFEALGDTVTCLLEPDNKDALVQVLTYHVVAGYVLAADITDGLNVTTLEKEDLTFKIEDKAVMIDTTSGGSATVTTPNVYATNGVVHVIDQVLIPQEFLDNNPCAGTTTTTTTAASIMV